MANTKTPELANRNATGDMPDGTDPPRVRSIKVWQCPHCGATRHPGTAQCPECGTYGLAPIITYEDVADDA